MAKKYFWMKLESNFFNSRKFRVLLGKENGHKYMMIYMELMLLSMESGNKLSFMNAGESLEQELALTIFEDEEDVRETLNYMEKVGCIERSEDGIYFLQVDERTGSESDSAKRVRKHRENKKKESVTCNVTCNEKESENVTLDIDKEIDIDIDKEIDIDKNTDKENNIKIASSDKSTSSEVSELVDENLKKIINTYEKNVGPIYPANRDWFIEVCENIEPPLFDKAVQICIDKNNVTPGYLKGIIRRWNNEKITTLREYNARCVAFRNKSKKYVGVDLNENYDFSNLEIMDEAIDDKMLAEVKSLQRELGVC